MASVSFVHPRTGQKKKIKVGWSWTLSLFSNIWGIPLFARRLFGWATAMVFLNGFNAYIFNEWSASHTTTGEDWAVYFFCFLLSILGTGIYLGLNGNALTAKGLLEKGWIWEHPESSDAVEAAKAWGLVTNFSASRAPSAFSADETRSRVLLLVAGSILFVAGCSAMVVSGSGPAENARDTVKNIFLISAGGVGIVFFGFCLVMGLKSLFFPLKGLVYVGPEGLTFRRFSDEMISWDQIDRAQLADDGKWISVWLREPDCYERKFQLFGGFNRERDGDLAISMATTNYTFDDLKLAMERFADCLLLANSKTSEDLRTRWNHAESPVERSAEELLPSSMSGAAEMLTPAAFSTSVADELEKLAALLARGLVTQAEFDAQKAKLFS